MPYALGTINAPGTLVAGYRRGDPIEPAVVEAWGLVEGEDFAADAPEQVAPGEAPVPARPADDTDRGAWVAYVVSRGTSQDDADNMPLDELMGLYPEDEQAATDEPARPSESAKKAEWVLYVTDHPQATADDASWAGDDTTTKADLIAWKPAATADETMPRPDLVAQDATAQANG